MVAERFDAAQTMRLWTVVILVTIGLSDVLDGYLARNRALNAELKAEGMDEHLAEVERLKSEVESVFTGKGQSERRNGFSKAQERESDVMFSTGSFIAWPDGTQS